MRKATLAIWKEKIFQKGTSLSLGLLEVPIDKVQGICN